MAPFGTHRRCIIDEHAAESRVTINIHHATHQVNAPVRGHLGSAPTSFVWPQGPCGEPAFSAGPLARGKGPPAPAASAANRMGSGGSVSRPELLSLQHLLRMPRPIPRHR